MPPLIDLTGKRFGRLRVLARTANNRHGQTRWSCQCDCGTVTVVTGYTLTFGDTKSCGCLQRDVVATLKLTHGAKRVGKSWPEYAAWQNMINRCRNPKRPDYSYYGGRGIKVCASWRENFSAFIADMGRRPPNTSIDRINNNGNYEPSNCRWATKSQQAYNRRPKTQR